MRVSEGYTDKPLTKAYDFSLPVRPDFTLYARREATLRFLRTSLFPSSPSALSSVLQTARNVFIPMNKDKEMLLFI